MAESGPYYIVTVGGGKCLTNTKDDRRVPYEISDCIPKKADVQKWMIETCDEPNVIAVKNCVGGQYLRNTGPLHVASGAKIGLGEKRWWKLEPGRNPHTVKLRSNASTAGLASYLNDFEGKWQDNNYVHMWQLQGWEIHQWWLDWYIVDAQDTEFKPLEAIAGGGGGGKAKNADELEAREKTVGEREEKAKEAETKAKSLDDREAELNKRDQELAEKAKEAETRSKDLDGRKATLDKREQELADREKAAAEKSDDDADKRAKELDEREAKLKQQEEDLEKRASQPALAAPQPVKSSSDDADKRARALDEREAKLKQQAQKLAQQEEALKKRASQQPAPAKANQAQQRQQPNGVGPSQDNKDEIDRLKREIEMLQLWRKNDGLKSQLKIADLEDQLRQLRNAKGNNTAATNGVKGSIQMNGVNCGHKAYPPPRKINKKVTAIMYDGLEGLDAENPRWSGQQRCGIDGHRHQHV